MRNSFSQVPMRKVRRRKRSIHRFFILLFSLIIAILFFLSVKLFVSQPPTDHYRMVYGKSTPSRIILRDNRDGCEYEQLDNGELKPLMANGHHVCVEE